MATTSARQSTEDIIHNIVLKQCSCRVESDNNPRISRSFQSTVKEELRPDYSFIYLFTIGSNHRDYAACRLCK